MRLPGSRNGYSRVHDEESDTTTASNEETTSSTDLFLPPEPPEYNSVSNDQEDAEPSTTGTSIEQMELENPSEANEDDQRLLGKMYRFRDRFSNNVIVPMRERIVDPLAQISGLVSEKVDYYLNKVGNPLILRRFFYVFLMSLIAYLVMSSGLMPNELSTGTKGMFSDFDILIDYAQSSVDLSKLERDLEYLSSMPHMSGTKGDWAIRKYIEESFINNKLKLVRETEYGVYSNYPNEASLKAHKNGQETTFEMTVENFNPLSANGDLKDINLIYGNKGSYKDLQTLRDSGLLDDDFVLLVHYGKVVSEQMLLAQMFKAKGILFITQPYGNDKDVIQKKSVAIHQYWTGDALTPGWYGTVIPKISPEESMSLPQIPSLPLSWNQGSKLISLLAQEGLEWENGEFSGKEGPESVHIDMKVETAIREDHPTHDIIGKIEGREQNDKAIVIAASRTNGVNGASYPDFGTAMLLSLIQSFQELKFKFGWRPLRSIYFISFGGSEFNFAGSTELIEQQLVMIKDEVYAVLDISQLGITSNEKRIDIQSHPLMHQFFKNVNNRMGFGVSVRNVEQYGDWTPFLANGIPVSILSIPEMIESKPPIDTSKDVFENIGKLLEEQEYRKRASDLLVYVLQASLKLADNPLMPFDITGYLNILGELLRDMNVKYANDLNFVGVIKSFLTWREIGEEWSAWSDGWKNIVYSRDEGLEPSLLSVHRWTWNKKISNIGRRQCSATGLSHRQFYKNIIFGPTLLSEDNEADSWSFPGVRDAIKEGDWNLAQEELDAVAKILEQSSALFLEETTDVGN